MNESLKNSGLESFLSKASEAPQKRESILQSVMDTHNYIQGSYYVSHPNLDLGECGKVNDVILMSIANAILGRNILVKGSYGLGKTTTAQAVSSLLYSLPIELVDKSMLQGHPFLTEEKIFGRVDLSKINKGEGEEVIFSLFSQTPGAKIVDEVNRIPPQTQNALLKAVETGQFGYLDRFVTSGAGKPSFFATANYEDLGNTAMAPPFLDRFDASVEVSQPLWLGNYIMGELNLSALPDDKKKAIAELNRAMISLIEANPEKAAEIRKEARKYIFGIIEAPDIEEQRARISNKSLSEKIQEVFADTHADYGRKLEESAKLQEKFKEQTEGITLKPEEIKALKEIGKSYPFSQDAQLYWNAFIDHINCIPKQAGATISNHDAQFPVGMVENQLSVRLRIRGREFAGLLSYLKGETAISSETIEQVLPYLIAHRAVFSDALEADASDDLTNSLSMRNANHLIREFREKIYLPHKEDIERIYGSMSSPSQTAEKYADHTEPSIREFAKRFRSKK
ncbi:MAG TPA: MoxR family ATPase [Candidatus Nanoarchaeia archaeon]|nr:MoxR family ATPase [Candidatus Nanoarchaeia archaeon]